MRNESNLLIKPIATDNDCKLMFRDPTITHPHTSPILVETISGSALLNLFLHFSLPKRDNFLFAMNIAKNAASKLAKGEKELEKKLVVLWDELPSWQQDNHYILSGYRPQTNSYIGSAKSLGYIHNETVNIYSHLVGAILAFISGAVSYRILQPRYETATKEDILVFSCYFLGAVACLSMSATYHTIQNHSPEVSSFGNKLDYLGIVFLIWGSFIPLLYYEFQSEPQLIKTYWTMVSEM